MSASPIALLKVLIARKGTSDKALALSWLEVFNVTARRPLKPSTVGSRLSNLLNDQLDGWQRYFGTPQSAAILFDLLDATDAERDVLSRCAAERLGRHGAARVVVDVHDFAGDEVALLVAVERAILRDRALLPAAVLLTEDQCARLPMRYAKREDLQLVEVADDDDAADAISARPHALVVSTLPPRDPTTGAAVITRWAALAWEDGVLVLDPGDAVEQFARDGALADLPSVQPAHRLDALGVAAEPPVADVRGPALRKRLQAIAEGTLDAPAATRLGEALAHGIAGASTDEERVRAALVGAGLPGEQAVDAKGLARALARAAARPTPATVFWSDGMWHLLNAPVPPTLLGHPRVQSHSAVAGTTPLQRLVAAVSGRTAMEWELDPLLEGVVRELDPGGAEAAEFAHARAWFLHGGHCVTAPAVAVADPLERLARLLAHAPPAAELRLTRLSSTQEEKRAVLLPVRDATLLERDVWAQVPPVGSVAWQSRETRLVVAWVRREEKAHGAHDFFSGSVWEAEAALPAAMPLDDDAWLDAFEARGPAAPVEHLRRRHSRAAAEEAAARQAAVAIADEIAGKASAPGSISHSKVRGLSRMRRPDGHDDGSDVTRAVLEVSTLAGPDWRELDLAVALAWGALRDALTRWTPVQLHDGRWLLPLSPGLLAAITVVAAPGSTTARAALGQHFRFGAFADRTAGWIDSELQPATGNGSYHISRSPIFGPVNAWEAHAPGVGIVRIGITVPVSVHLVGEGISCAVRFVSDPYGLATRSTAEEGTGHGPLGVAVSAVASAAALGVAAAEEEARRLRED